MFVRNEVSVYEFACALSEAVDLVSPILNSHHKKVAHIAYNLALEMNLPHNEVQDIVLAALLHDVGAFSTGERLKAHTFQLYEDDLNQHGIVGYKLLKKFLPLAKAAVLIKYHHTDFDPSRIDVPLGSYVIHLADRVAVLFDECREVLEQVPEVIEKITDSCHKFHPETLAAFLRIAKLEYVWLGAFLPSDDIVALKKVRFSKEIVELETLRTFARIVAQIVDFRSRFTATHSSGVAAVAKELAAISGFSERECNLMEIAGLLHDLGKVAVPNEILEKNGTLSNEEFNIIRKHTYHTFAVLNKVNGLKDIASWAAFHHERQDGSGYPFHVQGEDFPMFARVMAVADVFTALAEDRPHRKGLDRDRAAKILFDMAENGGIDKRVVGLADRNFFRINDVRVMAQQRARREYEISNAVIYQPFLEHAVAV